LNFAFEYYIRRCQEKHERLKLNGTHQLPVFADGVNLLGANMSTIKRNTEALLDASEKDHIQDWAYKINTENEFECLH
jgi:hypothetical protein